ncbi:hypothetical protein GCM10023175_61450 [Pseudonocardia xishanensis]|uniref:DUF4282 domain-containing protein n=2 Tax=Pseudonocardia xishanensis TaxID=630995 RepID=A0ABP8S1U5_9PSEU
MSERARESSDRYEPGVLAALTDLNFDRSATPAVARFLYVVGLVLIAVGYVALVLLLFSRGLGLGVAALVGGAVAAVFSLLLLRVVLEFLVAVVRLSDDLRGGHRPVR